MDKPFTTDKCSMFPEGDWGGCCVEHDKVYWKGGSYEDRRKADIELMRCVAGQGRPWVAMIMYIGVRIGGAAHWPVPWRWGYGWKWPRCSGPDSKDEDKA